jgi:DnaJ-class molecular chaperone
MRRVFELLARARKQLGAFMPRLPDPIVRVVLVLVVLIVAVLVVRRALPPSLTDTHVQIAAAVRTVTAQEISYAGAPKCAECHEAESTKKATGYHRTVSCETCHGPAVQHTLDPVEVKPPAPRDRLFCPTCHAYNLSRPKGFPQINPVTHNPLQPCFTCHDPHDPKPKTAPGECTACHGGIARTKAVSPHALLECTTCHETPEEHKITPRSVHPSKPTARDFCGQCHGKDSAVPNAPKVDVSTHGEKYLCWQCHYPHMPEVG